MARGHLPPTLEASFASGRCLPVLLFLVELPATDPLALLYGAGEIEVLGQKFVGSDDRFGSLESLSPPEDGFGDQAPNMQFVMNCPSGVAATTLASAEYQGSRTRLWVGGLERDPVTEAVTWAGEYLLFDGVLDRPVLEVDGGVQSVEFECVSGFEELFSDSEGQRLADASHQEVFPGELGFVHVSGIQRTIIWGPGDRPHNSTPAAYGKTKPNQGKGWIHAHGLF